MTAIAPHTPLNAVQLHLLNMFNYAKSKKELTELKNVLQKHFQQKVDDEMDMLWGKQKLSSAKMDEILKSHNRTPYK
jgi:hypothetical protein